MASSREGRDILQRAILEVGPMESGGAAVRMSMQPTTSSLTDDLSFLLDTNSSSSANLLDVNTSSAASTLMNSAADAVTAPSALSNEQLLDELASVAANTAAVSTSFFGDSRPSSESASNLDEQVVNVIQGSVAQTSTSPSSTSTSMAASNVRRRKQILSPSTVKSQNIPDAPLVTAKKSAPPPANSDLVVTPSSGIVLVNRPDGSQIVMMKTPQALQQQQQQKIVNSRPAILNRRAVPQQQQQQQQQQHPTFPLAHVAAAAQPTSRQPAQLQQPLAPLIMMGPVMTPSVAAPSSTNVRRTPYILPKPPTLKPQPAIRSNTKDALLIDPPRKANLGSSSNPIQLIQRGNTFHTNQPLSDSQLTQVANIIKKSDPDIASKTTEIIVERDDGKTIYKVTFSEDADEASEETEDPKSKINKLLEAGEGHVDNEDEVEVRDVFPDELFPDSELAKRLTAEAKAKMAKSKRGRPRKSEQLQRTVSDEQHAKKLRNEFGFSKVVLQAVEKEIVADKDVKLEERKAAQLNVEDDEERSEKVPVMSWTRSGRLSKPPPSKDELLSSKIKRTSPPEPPPLVLEPQPKKKYEVPDRYRCRVCHKVYIGDRKMARHMKLYPSHGPIDSIARVQVMPVVAPTQPTASAYLPKMPTTPGFAIPIIPMARTQLEELVKNLDAELVLDVVSKKMFDNFSMWELETRKALLQPGRGIRRLTKMFDDLEKMVGEAKRLVDNCLTDAKLYGEGSCAEQAACFSFGENLQNALSLHEGPWYMEPARLIPEEYRKILNIEQETPCSDVLASPRSDSAAVFPSSFVSNSATSTSKVSGGNMEEDNSNSLISAASSSERGETSSMANSNQGAPQMILEKNLGARSLDEMDDDTQDGSVASLRKKGEELDDSKAAESPEGQGEEEEEVAEEEELEVEDEEDMQHENPPRQDVDPKRVLEQHGIDIGANEGLNQQQAASPAVGARKSSTISSSDLAKEIDSLSGLAGDANENQKTPLPSFSSILSGQESPKAGGIPPTTTGQDMSGDITMVASTEAPVSIVVTSGIATSSMSDMMGQDAVSIIPSDVMQTQDDRNSIAGLIEKQEPGNLISSIGDGPSSVLSHLSGPPSVGGNRRPHLSRSSSIDQPCAQQEHQAERHVSGSSCSTNNDVQYQQVPLTPVPVQYQMSGPPSVASVDHNPHVHASGPSSVASAEHHLHHQHHQYHVTDSPIVDQQYPQMQRLSGPPSVVDAQMQQQQQAGSPCVLEQHPVSQHQFQAYSVPHSAGPGSIDLAVQQHFSNPPSVEFRHHGQQQQQQQRHPSQPDSPMCGGGGGDVLTEAASVVAAAMRRNSVSALPTVCHDQAVAAAVLAESSPAELINPPPSVGSYTPASVAALPKSSPTVVTPVSITFPMDAAVVTPVSSALTGNSVVVVPGDEQQQFCANAVQASQGTTGIAVTTSSATAASEIAPSTVVTSSSEANLLSDLDSVLAEAAAAGVVSGGGVDDEDFPFHSTLSGDSLHLKTPEKLLQSIPPSSLIKVTEEEKAELEGAAAKPMAVDPDGVVLKTSSETPLRTSFLGAISTISSASSTSATPATSASDAVVKSVDDDVDVSNQLEFPLPSVEVGGDEEQEDGTDKTDKDGQDETSETRN